ncbi:MAG: M1 family metallopeptidase, partial [Planctomycetota bacterium]
LSAASVEAQRRDERPDPPDDKFRQLDELLPDPSDYRTASGAPGHRYWQQQADYEIDVTIDDERQRLVGSETITYTNHSPDTLTYLWVQLEANIFAPHSDSNLTRTAPDFEEFSFRTLQRLLAAESFDGSMEVTRVADAQGQPLPHTINKTMMRIDLPKPLASGASTRFSIDWSYAINDAKVIRARTGYEYFKRDDNYLYELAHWFPRMAAYTDVNGWQNKQFLGSGEFTLEFGDYTVRITVPDDHVVASTGVLQNPDEILTATQRDRLEQARTAEKPMFIITPEEALANEKSKPTGTKTWIYHAKNVRDFAFATSRKFIWDAKLERVGPNDVWAMSYYPNEGEPLWSRYSTHSIIHTLQVYSRYAFDYPYPVAISVNGPIGGMEYPMICFNGPRPEEDGTYTKRTKYGLIGVIIHEVGHFYFPMIVNSDERQWTWMDEGVNTFVQFLAQEEWEEGYPSRRGEARDMVDYMTSDRQVPIMTNSESILQFGANAYGKPATALNVLRETVMGTSFTRYSYSMRSVLGTVLLALG